MTNTIFYKSLFFLFLLSCNSQPNAETLKLTWERSIIFYNRNAISFTHVLQVENTSFSDLVLKMNLNSDTSAFFFDEPMERTIFYAEYPTIPANSTKKTLLIETIPHQLERPSENTTQATYEFLDLKMEELRKRRLYYRGIKDANLEVTKSPYFQIEFQESFPPPPLEVKPTLHIWSELHKKNFCPYVLQGTKTDFHYEEFKEKAKKAIYCY